MNRKALTMLSLIGIMIIAHQNHVIKCQQIELSKLKSHIHIINTIQYNYIGVRTTQDLLSTITPTRQTQNTIIQGEYI